MKHLYFDCEGTGLSMWLEDYETIEKDGNLTIKITKDEIDKIIENFQSFKFLVEYEQNKKNVI